MSSQIQIPYGRAARRLQQILRLTLVGTLLAAPLHARAEQLSRPVVTVSGGKLEGAVLPAPGGAVFKGIPYAAAPVGNLRWRAPQPARPWRGVRPALDYGATCAQSDHGWNKLAVEHESEDCLFLNVWTPAWPAKEKLPVLVWIHGGGNSGGSALGGGGIEPPFDGQSLARHGVVLVSIQYRLGFLGFMGHPELTAESAQHASGDYALLDQLAALKWVRQNIARFGGDPASLTVFGQSAGAQDISILMTSPLATGMFDKAILESGSPMISDKRLQSPAQMEQLGVALATALKAPPSGAIAYLRSLPAANILGAKVELPKGLILDVGMDGYVVPDFSPAVFRAGREIRIPMLIGSNGRESNGAGPGPGGPFGTRPRTPQEASEAFKSSIERALGRYPDLFERALLLYGVGAEGALPATDPSYGSTEAQFGTDYAFRCENTALAQWHSAVAPTWQYEFTAGLEAHPPAHSGELDFVFGYLRDQAADPALRALSDQMQQYWANFARHGDPNGAGLPVWPKYDPEHRGYLNFSNADSVEKSALRESACALYREALTRDIEARTPR